MTWGPPWVLFPYFHLLLEEDSNFNNSSPSIVSQHLNCTDRPRYFTVDTLDGSRVSKQFSMRISAGEVTWQTITLVEYSIYMSSYHRLRSSKSPFISFSLTLVVLKNALGRQNHPTRNTISEACPQGRKVVYQGIVRLSGVSYICGSHLQASQK